MRVGADQFLSADAAEFAGVEHAQQLRLGGERQLADLVEEQRAAVGDLEQPELASDAAGEGAALVAEQLAFGERLGDGGAIQLHERLARARRALVHEARGQFLADAGVAVEQHRRVGPGGHGQILDTGKERGRFADHLHFLAGDLGARRQTVDRFHQVRRAARVLQRIGLDAHVVRVIVLIVMRVQHVKRLQGAEDLVVRAVLAVEVARHRRVMRHLVAAAADDLGRLHAVGGAVGRVGGDDAVLAIDNDGGRLLRFDQRLDAYGRTAHALTPGGGWRGRPRRVLNNRQIVMTGLLPI